MDDGLVTIEILRKPRAPHQGDLLEEKKPGPEAKEDIVGFKVSDNGIGFTEPNMESFRTLDSDFKAAKGCKGIGRLLWLKAFAEVRVDSVFVDENGQKFSRAFHFTPRSGISHESTAPLNGDKPRETVVHLIDFNPRYREYSRKTASAIADSIFEHCLWYFIREGSAPLIYLVDDDERISLNDVFDGHMHTSAERDTIDLKGHKFDLVHVKLRSNSLLTHTIALCADNRLVSEEKLAGKVPGLHGRLSDQAGEFVYSCYVSSPFLNEHARPERTGFEILETADALFADKEVSLSDIREAIVESAKKHLSEHLSENMKRSKERVTDFVSKKAPRYRPILSRIPDGQLNIDPAISDRDLDLALHKHLATLESELLTEGHEIMTKGQSEKPDDYEKRLREYLAKAEDIKKSDLAGYVSHRRVIIDLFEKAIERDSNGNYVREDLLHSLIMPMRTESNELLPDGCNLWLIDERLAFHNYLASDKTLKAMPITGSNDTKEPDICALNVFDEPLLVSEESAPPLASLEVVEIKRPVRKDAAPGEEHDPIEQAVGYLRRIREGKVSTASGRPIPASESIPGFCYILADLTPQFEQRCKDHHDLKRTADGLGYFGYKGNVNAYIEVISFNRLVNAAKERNRAFFDKLGLPAN